jgi:hypothetical protein
MTCPILLWQGNVACPHSWERRQVPHLFHHGTTLILFLISCPHEDNPRLKTLDANGKFTYGVDYTTGCEAVRGSWPAQQHWKRVSTFAAAYHGGFKGALNYSGDPAIREAIGRGMKWWFDNDLQNNECLDEGGEAECPCDTPGMWNTNWFSNVKKESSSICSLPDI